MAPPGKFLRRIAERDVQMIRTVVGEMSERAYKFAQLYCERGGRNAHKCAVDAGYSEASASAMANSLLRDERVLSLIEHFCATALRAAIVTATDQLQRLALNGDTTDAVKLKASESILDRASKLLTKVTEHRVVVEDRRSPAPGAAVAEFIQQNASDLGIVVVDPDRLTRYLETAARVGVAQSSAIDVVDFEEIEEGREGIEDLLG